MSAGTAAAGKMSNKASKVVDCSWGLFGLPFQMTSDKMIQSFEIPSCKLCSRCVPAFMQPNFQTGFEDSKPQYRDLLECLFTSYTPMITSNLQLYHSNHLCNEVAARSSKGRINLVQHIHAEPTLAASGRYFIGRTTAPCCHEFWILQILCM